MPARGAVNASNCHIPPLSSQAAEARLSDVGACAARRRRGSSGSTHVAAIHQPLCFTVPCYPAGVRCTGAEGTLPGGGADHLLPRRPPNSKWKLPMPPLRSTGCRTGDPTGGCVRPQLPCRLHLPHPAGRAVAFDAQHVSSKCCPVAFLMPTWPANTLPLLRF